MLIPRDALFRTWFKSKFNISVLLVELCFRRFAPIAIFLSQIDLSRSLRNLRGEHFSMIFERKSS